MCLARFLALLRAHRSCLSVSSWDMSSNFIAWRLRQWGILTCIVPSDGPSFSWILAWRSVEWVNRTRWIGPKTFCIGFPRACAPLWDSNGSDSCETQPNCGTVFTKATALFSSSVGMVALLGLFTWLFFNFVVREQTQTSVPCFATRFCFKRLDIREDANTHKAISCKYFSNSISTSVNESHQGLLLPLILLFFDTLRPRVIDGSEGVAASDVGFCARSLLSCRKLHWFPFEHWPFSFHW